MDTFVRLDYCSFSFNFYLICFEGEDNREGAITLSHKRFNFPHFINNNWMPDMEDI